MTQRKHIFILALIVTSRFPEAVPLKKDTSEVILDGIVVYFTDLGTPQLY